MRVDLSGMGLVPLEEETAELAALSLPSPCEDTARNLLSLNQEEGLQAPNHADTLWPPEQ